MAAPTAAKAYGRGLRNAALNARRIFSLAVKGASLVWLALLAVVPCFVVGTDDAVPALCVSPARVVCALVGACAKASTRPTEQMNMTTSTTSVNLTRAFPILLTPLDGCPTGGLRLRLSCSTHL